MLAAYCEASAFQYVNDDSQLQRAPDYQADCGLHIYKNDRRGPPGVGVHGSPNPSNYRESTVTTGHELSSLRAALLTYMVFTNSRITVNGRHLLEAFGGLLLSTEAHGVGVKLLFFGTVDFGCISKVRQ